MKVSKAAVIAYLKATATEFAADKQLADECVRNWGQCHDLVRDSVARVFTLAHAADLVAERRPDSLVV